MRKRWILSRTTKVVFGTFLVISFAVAPASLDLRDYRVVTPTADAKGPGGNAGGNGNGNAGGNSGNHGNGKEMGVGHSEARGKSGKAMPSSTSAHYRSGKPGQASGKSIVGGPAPDRFAADAVSGVDHAKDRKGKAVKSGGISASALGSLNAAHASATARAHAASNSQVGRIASYESALQAALESDPADESQLQAAADALAGAANKSISPEVVGAVNDLLGLEVDPEIEADIAERAETGRGGASETSEGGAPSVTF